jgi:hypothetical protein
VLAPLIQKLQPNSNKTRKLFALIHMDNARVHTARVTQDKLDVSRFKRIPQPLYSQDIASSNFFPFGWLTTQFQQREYDGEDELYEVVDEILADLSTEMIETVFGDWMDRLKCVIDGNSDYVS